MIAAVEEQLTTEGKLICLAIIVGGLSLEGRLRPSDPADEHTKKVLIEATLLLNEFRSEAQQWPEASH